MFQSPLSVFVGLCLGRESPGSESSSMFKFLRSHRTVPHGSPTIHSPVPPAADRGSGFSTCSPAPCCFLPSAPLPSPLPPSLLLCLSDCSHPCGSEMVHGSILICISGTTKVGSLRELSAVCISVLEQCPFVSSAHFKISLSGVALGWLSEWSVRLRLRSRSRGL